MNTTWRTFVSLCGLGILLLAVRARADDPAAVNLFDSHTLAGWDYGPKRASGWRMADGELQGDQHSTPLVSGWSWGDVELSFRWRVDSTGHWRVRLLNAENADHSITLALSEGSETRARYNGKDSFGEVVVAPSADGWHKATLSRKGNNGKLAVMTRTADGLLLKSDVTFSVGKERFGLELNVANGSGQLTDLTANEPTGKPIYNEKDLSGWWTPGNLASWKPEGESLVCVNSNGNYLRTEREYANFTLSLEYKMAKGGNSGIGIRTARNAWPSGDGMELQLYDERDGTPLTRHSTMAIYGNLEPLARADHSQQWNRVAIKAEGYMISAWVNGVLVQHANTAELPELRRRNLKGWIGLQDHGARTEFRNLNVLEAPDGLGLDAWQTPRPKSGSQLVLDRLMSTERLAIDDGLGSGAVQVSVGGAGEQVLAELKGPAAVVVVSRTNQSGRLAFYFNGESTPRLECPADKLPEYLPLVGQDTQPLLTYLPYRKSLRVTLTDGKEANYRLDYVTFADETPVEDFVEGGAYVARGLLPAMSYRNEQLGWGTHREGDPLPRAGAEGRKIEEQSQSTLVDLNGPGIVEWTKLIAAPSLLADDDLWLEVTVDDEAAPAIAAPARYFFPGLAGGNYPNYVVLNRNGWTNMLAMPFRSRLTIAVANHGRRPVNPVGITISYQPLSDSNDPRLAHRLRGVFATESDPADRCWTTQSGSGWFIGLVTQLGQASVGIDALEIDGRPREGWRSTDGRSFFGMAPEVTNERHSLSGRQGGFQWRFFLLAPPEFRESFQLRASEGAPLGNRLALFYIRS
jgi:hypothetical protein